MLALTLPACTGNIIGVGSNGGQGAGQGGGTGDPGSMNPGCAVNRDDEVRLAMQGACVFQIIFFDCITRTLVW